MILLQSSLDFTPCAAFCEPDGDDCATGEACIFYDEFWGNVAPAPRDFGMCVPIEEGS